MEKKAQGISINTIIVAAIALIVLVVLIAIFTGRLGEFSIGVSNCKDKGGTCVGVNEGQSAADACAAIGAPLRGTDCANRDKNPSVNMGTQTGICCIPIEAK